MADNISVNVSSLDLKNSKIGTAIVSNIDTVQATGVAVGSLPDGIEVNDGSGFATSITPFDLDSIYEVVSYLNSVSVVTDGYNGAAYSPNQDRIYFAPYTQSAQSNWHYIDCTDGSIVAYAHGATVLAEAYIGCVYSPNQDRIYFVPHKQATQTNWHYIDCATGNVVAYAHGVTAVNFAYAGAAYSPNQDRIYFVPYSQADQTNWHYIDCATGNVVAYAHGATVLKDSYTGAAYSPNQDRIYFVPRSHQTNWHYIDCTDGSVVAYVNGATIVANAYVSATYSPNQDRIYFVPLGQATQTNWHYIDCTDGSIVAYIHGATADIYAYAGAAYSPNQDRIYFVPLAQSNQTNWHYIDCTDGNVVAYAHGATVVINGYNGAAYSPNQDRIYFVPYAQGPQTNWHYLNCSASSNSKKTLTFRHDPTSTTLSIPSQLTISGNNDIDVYCDVQPQIDYGSVDKGNCSSKITIRVENTDTISRDVTGITAPAGFECKKTEDSAWLSAITSFTLLTGTYQDIDFRSCTPLVGEVSGEATLSYNPTLTILLSVISLASEFKCELITTHVADAKSRLIRQYRQGSNVEDIVGALVTPLQQSENDIYELYSSYDIDTMEGDNLDKIGAIIGQTRSGYSDEDYRILLKVRVAINNSRGTLDNVISIWSQLNSNETIEITEQFPAQIELKTTLVRSTQQQEDLVYELMKLAILAGVNIVWILPYRVAGDGIFKFDSVSILDYFDTGVFNGTLNS